MLAKLTSKNQLTLPKAVTQGLGPVEYFDVQTRDGQIVLAALQANPQFISAALPHRLYPPMFNHYEGGQAFGNHVDNALMGRLGRHLSNEGERERASGNVEQPKEAAR